MICSILTGIETPAVLAVAMGKVFEGDSVPVVTGERPGRDLCGGGAPTARASWLGGGPPHPELRDFPTAALLAPPNTAILPGGMGSHLVGHHGGITPQELLISLLVADETPSRRKKRKSLL